LGWALPATFLWIANPFMLGGDPPIKEDSGGTGFQPVPAQAKACDYILPS